MARARRRSPLLLAGAHAPDSGELYFEGRQAAWPFQARRLGIEVVGQQPEMAENLDITRNVFLGDELGWSVFGRWLRVPNLHEMDARAPPDPGSSSACAILRSAPAWPTCRSNSAN